MLSWPSVGKAALVLLAIALLCWFALGQVLDMRRQNGASRALAYLCMEDTRALGELCRQYEQMNASPPTCLADLVSLATNRPWIFSCGLVDKPKYDRIMAPIPSVTNGVSSIRITYLYFTNAVEGVRIMCPAWHPRLTAVDVSGAIRDVDRETWDRISWRIGGKSPHCCPK